MTRSLVRPLTRSLVRSLVRGPSLDPDAAAYIDALVSGGATVSSVQSDAIDTFIRAEKSGSRWDLIKRMYLPIWGIAAPNAICMRSLTSGTFVGGVTHGAGFVKSNGTTGYFDIGTNCAGVSISGSNGLYFSVIKAQSTINLNSAMNMGAIDGSSNPIQDFRLDNGDGRRITFARSVSSAGTSLDTSKRTGVLVASRTASNLAKAFDETGELVQSTDNSPGVPTSNIFLMARSNSGSPNNFSTAEIGIAGFGQGVNDGGSTALAANLKTLWETCTPHTLP